MLQHKTKVKRFDKNNQNKIK